MSKVSDAERAFGSIFRSPEALEAIKASEEADKLVRRTNAAADARLKMRDDMSRAIEATNCMMVKVAGTNHFVRTNKIEARNLCRLTGGAIPYRAEAGFLYIG